MKLSKTMKKAIQRIKNAPQQKVIVERVHSRETGNLLFATLLDYKGRMNASTFKALVKRGILIERESGYFYLSN